MCREIREVHREVQRNEGGAGAEQDFEISALKSAGGGGGGGDGGGLGGAEAAQMMVQLKEEMLEERGKREDADDKVRELEQRIAGRPIPTLPRPHPPRARRCRCCALRGADGFLLSCLSPRWQLW